MHSAPNQLPIFSGSRIAELRKEIGLHFSALLATVYRTQRLTGSILDLVLAIPLETFGEISCLLILRALLQRENSRRPLSLHFFSTIMPMTHFFPNEKTCFLNYIFCRKRGNLFDYYERNLQLMGFSVAHL